MDQYHKQLALYPMTSGFLHCELSINDCADLPQQEATLSAFLGCFRASPAAFGNPRRAIVSRDAHFLKIDLKKKSTTHANVAGRFSRLFLEFTWVIWQKWHRRRLGRKYYSSDISQTDV